MIDDSWSLMMLDDIWDKRYAKESNDQHELDDTFRNIAIWLIVIYIYTLQLNYNLWCIINVHPTIDSYIAITQPLEFPARFVPGIWRGLVGPSLRPVSALLFEW